MSGEALKSDSSPEVENGHDISETLERVYAMRNKDEAYDLAHELDEAGLGANAKIAGAFRERSRLLEARNNIIGSIKRTSSLDKLQERRQEIEKLIEEDNVSLNEDDIEMVRAAFDETEGNLSQDDISPDDGKIEDSRGTDVQNDTDSKKESPADVFVRKVQNAQREFDEARNQGRRVEAEKTEETKPEAKVVDFSEIEKDFEDLKKDIDAQFDQLQAEIKTEFDRLLTQEYYVWMKDEQRIAKIKYENGVWFEDFGQKSKQTLRDRADAVRQTIIEDMNSGVSSGENQPVESKKDIEGIAGRIHRAVMEADGVDASYTEDTNGDRSMFEQAKVHVEPILVEGDNTLKGAVDLLADYFAPAVDEQDKDLSRGARITEFFDSRGKSEQPKADAEAIAGVGDDKLKGAVDLLADYFAPAVDEQDKDLSRGARITEFFNSDTQVGENNAVNSDAVSSDVGDAIKKGKGMIPEGEKKASATPFFFKFYFDRYMMPKEKNGDGLTMEEAVREFPREEFLGVSVETVVNGFQQFLVEQNGGKYDENGKLIRGSDEGFFSNDERIPKIRRLIKERYEELGLNMDGTEMPEGERPRKKVGFSLRKAFIKSLNRR